MVSPGFQSFYRAVEGHYLKLACCWGKADISSILGLWKALDDHLLDGPPIEVHGYKVENGRQIAPGTDSWLRKIEWAFKPNSFSSSMVFGSAFGCFLKDLLQSFPGQTNELLLESDLLLFSPNFLMFQTSGDMLGSTGKGNTWFQSRLKCTVRSAKQQHWHV